MATSNSYDFSATRDDIIDTALRNAAGLGDWETPSDTQKTKAAFLLNSIIKSYHTIGMPIWTNKKIEIVCSLFDAEGKVTIGIGDVVNEPKPLKISQIMLKVDDNTRELFLTDRQTYNRFASNASRGVPSAAYYQSNRDSGDLFLYPFPSTEIQTEGTIILWHHTTLQDVDVTSDEIDFPVEWIRLIIAELSVDLAPAYGLPIQERNLLLQSRDMLKLEAQNFNAEEGSVFLQP